MAKLAEKGDRVQVTNGHSRYGGQKGRVIEQISKVCVSVKLDNYPKSMAFAFNELKVI